MDRHPEEAARLKALARYLSMGAQASDDFDLLTELAASLCQTPYALISLVDQQVVWVRSAVGVRAAQIARDECYCALSILEQGALDIPDLQADPRTAHMRLTSEPPHFRMYSSVNLLSEEGLPLGTLCVLDTRPRALDAHARALLARLARQVMALFALRDRERSLHQTLHQLQFLANHDELTTLANRRCFLLRLQDECERARRTRAPLAVVMIDLDHFKRINDNFGHGMGDQVLATVGKLLCTHLRKIDVSGRLGGEELCLALPGTASAAAVHVAESLRQRIAALSWPAAGAALRVTASFGVSCLTPDGAGDAASVLESADAALYHAKHTGRDRVCAA